MRSLLDAERVALLQLARSAVVKVVAPDAPPAAIPRRGIFAERRGAFVTLRTGTRLRGCIGVLEGRESLGETVARCAASAATEDPRFSPVRADELDEIRIELSILSPLTPIRPEDVVIGVHGLAIMAEGRKGVLLPQVATEHHLDRERFLAETCHKAGLATTAWREPQTQISGFTTQTFSEPD